VLGGAAAALVVIGLAVPHTSDDPLPEPGWADRELTALPPGTKVLNDWALGGYLMWRYPQLDLVMHGYGDTFTTAELTRNNDLLSTRPGWQQDLRHLGVRVAVLRQNTALAIQLATTQGWRVVERSGDLELLEAPAGWPSGG
jgi:hypothetical protein